MFFKIVKGTFNLGASPQQRELPAGQYFLSLGGMRWREDKAAVFAPHLASHHLGGVTAVAHGDSSGIVHELRDLL